MTAIEFRTGAMPAGFMCRTLVLDGQSDRDAALDALVRFKYACFGGYVPATGRVWCDE